MPICMIPGDTTSWNIFTMHQDPAVFGTDVESYRMALEFKEVRNEDPVAEYVENLKPNIESAHGVPVVIRA
jgi:hypothetical protein